jgi:integrase-like protein
MLALPVYRAMSCAAVAHARAGPFTVRETTPVAPPKPRLLDRVREAIRARHYSRRTEKTYVAWIRRYILFHGKRHPAEMGAAEVTRFLTSLAVDGHVAASTQNQALSALLFLYREVLNRTCRGSTTWCARRGHSACLSCSPEPTCAPSSRSSRARHG